jgi:hypothetical protein
MPPKKKELYQQTTTTILLIPLQLPRPLHSFNVSIMVKISTFALFAATAVASLVVAAPVVAPADNITVAIPSAPVNETVPVDLVGEEDPLVTLNSNDPFSTSITHRGKATWVSNKKDFFPRMIHRLSWQNFDLKVIRSFLEA